MKHIHGIYISLGIYIHIPRDFSTCSSDWVYCIGLEIWRLKFFTMSSSIYSLHKVCHDVFDDCAKGPQSPSSIKFYLFSQFNPDTKTMVLWYSYWQCYIIMILLLQAWAHIRTKLNGNTQVNQSQSKAWGAQCLGVGLIFRDWIVHQWWGTWVGAKNGRGSLGRKQPMLSLL